MNRPHTTPFNSTHRWTPPPKNRARVGWYRPRLSIKATLGSYLCIFCCGFCPAIRTTAQPPKLGLGKSFATYFANVGFAGQSVRRPLGGERTLAAVCTDVSSADFSAIHIWRFADAASAHGCSTLPAALQPMSPERPLKAASRSKIQTAFSLHG